MVFCRGCGKQLHETALTCPGCGAPQTSSNQAQDGSDGPLWRPIITLVIGILAVCPFADGSNLNHDTTVGVAMFGVGDLIFGGWTLSQQKHGRWLAIGGVALSVIALLALLGR